mmetsp:Transcript_11949/g.33096  ORF Transcript_11949/g.33096 Transcript_11949/m.33096 type:complete len:97 (+) Transcript_11949:474-764(+)
MYKAIVVSTGGMCAVRDGSHKNNKGCPIQCILAGDEELADVSSQSPPFPSPCNNNRLDTWEKHRRAIKSALARQKFEPSFAYDSITIELQLILDLS